MSQETSLAHLVNEISLRSIEARSGSASDWPSGCRGKIWCRVLGAATFAKLGPRPRHGHAAVAHCQRMTTLYRYSFDKRLVAFWGVFGVRSAKDGVTLTDDGRLRATFGFLAIESPLENVDGAHITRNYRWWTAAGARGSLKDDGLTFGTNANAGVCIHFREKVPSPLRRTGHSALTVTVEDLEGLTASLTRR
jgi:hypothetical protein